MAILNTKPPVGFWLIGIAFLLWNLYAAYDCYLSLNLNAEHLARFGEDMTRFLSTLPIWASASWAYAVTAGLIASVLFLLRKSWAGPIFATALIASIIIMLYLIFAGNSPDMGAMKYWSSLLVILVGSFEVWFSMRASRKRWLR